MSWWDASNFTSLASNALKNAQKKIDKVLDISEEDGRNTDVSGGAGKEESSRSKSRVDRTEARDPNTEQRPDTKAGEEEFWNTWFVGEKNTEGEAAGNRSRKTKLAAKRKKAEQQSTIGQLEEPTDETETPGGCRQRTDNVEERTVSDVVEDIERTVPLIEEHSQAAPVPESTNSAENPENSSLHNIDTSDEDCIRRDDLITKRTASDTERDQTTPCDDVTKDDNEQKTPHPDELDGRTEEAMTSYLGDGEEPRRDESDVNDTSDYVRDTSDSTETITGESEHVTQHDNPADGNDCMETDNPIKSDIYIVSEQESYQDVLATPSGDQLADRTPSNEMVESTSSVGSSSYVKLDETMADSMKLNDLTNSKSDDIVKIGSSNSGHTSGDEIETTTSSDIEIISNPTPNGENKMEVTQPFDLTPLQTALSLKSNRKTSPPHDGHGRSDSRDSMSSFNTIDPRLSPVVGPETIHQRALEEGQAWQTQPKEIQTFLKIDNSSEETQHLMKPRSGSGNKDLVKKLSETSEILEIRESKLIDLSRDNMELAEANNILTSQLQQLEEVHANETSDVNAITNEFTQRMSEMEKRYQTACRERDNLKKQLQNSQEQLLSQVSDKKTERLLRDQEEQIDELLQEGGKLSKQQLQSNTIIKKLRSKDKEHDVTIKEQRNTIAEQKTEVSHLKTVLDSKIEMEKKQTEAINQLNAAVKNQETELLSVKSDLEDAQERVCSMQSALDASYKELAELHKAHATKDSQVQEVALSSAMAAKEELRLVVEKQQQQANRDREGLLMQVEDMRLSISRSEKDYGRREDVFKQEIAHLHQRLQEADGRNDDLTQHVSSATRPLLRQIENLQASFNVQSASWEKVERSLTERLADAQNQLVEAQERDRSSNDRLMDATSKFKSLESQNATFRQEKLTLTAELEMERTKTQFLEESNIEEKVNMEVSRQSSNKEALELKREKILLENQLHMERVKLEAKKKKVPTATLR